MIHKESQKGHDKKPQTKKHIVTKKDNTPRPKAKHLQPNQEDHKLTTKNNTTYANKQTNQNNKSTQNQDEETQNLQ